MKKILLLLLPGFLIITLFVQCRKDVPDGSIYDTKFYTELDTAKGKMFLYVDGQYKGELNYFTQDPECGDVGGDRLSTLDLQLKSGTYLIEGKDGNGKVLSSTEMFFSKAKMSSSGGIGGQSTYATGNCIRIGLFE